MKTCTGCKELKSISEFNKNKNMKDGLQYVCRECSKKRCKNYYQTPKGKYADYKKSAKTRGYEFNLTFSEFTLITAQDCQYCGKEAGGIDRYDNSKGYTLDNCVPCCTTCNRLKSNNDFYGWLEHMEGILDHQKTNKF